MPFLTDTGSFLAQTTVGLLRLWYGDLALSRSYLTKEVPAYRTFCYINIYRRYKVVDEIQQLQKCLKKVDASFLIVSNEVGLGLVPDNRMGRLYRDNLGRANQMLAQTADQVMLLVAGIPLQVKPNDSL